MNTIHRLVGAVALTALALTGCTSEVQDADLTPPIVMAESSPAPTPAPTPASTPTEPSESFDPANPPANYIPDYMRTDPEESWSDEDSDEFAGDPYEPGDSGHDPNNKEWEVPDHAKDHPYDEVWASATEKAYEEQQAVLGRGMYASTCHGEPSAIGFQWSATAWDSPIVTECFLENDVPHLDEVWDETSNQEMICASIDSTEWSPPFSDWVGVQMDEHFIGSDFGMLYLDRQCAWGNFDLPPELEGEW